MFKKVTPPLIVYVLCLSLFSCKKEENPQPAEINKVHERYSELVSSVQWKQVKNFTTLTYRNGVIDTLGKNDDPGIYWNFNAEGQDNILKKYLFRTNDEVIFSYHFTEDSLLDLNGSPHYFSPKKLKQPLTNLSIWKHDTIQEGIVVTDVYRLQSR